MTISNHLSLNELVEKYVHYLMQTGYSFEQVIVAHNQLDYFVAWADRRYVDHVDHLKEDLAAHYCTHLKREQDIFKIQRIGTRVFRERITKLRRFYEWLYRKGYLQTELAPSVPRITKQGEVSRKPRKLATLSV
jgi:site-specific recombinase XerD